MQRSARASSRRTSGSKFRATFATWSLWAGVDLRTVQQWLGHSDMESTMRYLKPSRSQQVRDKVNEIFA
jgi:integrase/recombinase XerD